MSFPSDLPLEACAFAQNLKPRSKPSFAKPSSTPQSCLLPQRRPNSLCACCSVPGYSGNNFGGVVSEAKDETLSMFEFLLPWKIRFVVHQPTSPSWSLPCRIWELLAEPVRVGELCNRLQAEFEVSSEECVADVVPFLASMQADGLIAEHSENED